MKPFTTIVETDAFLAEEALRLVIILATNRTLAGALSVEEIARDWIIARLACGPQPFSKLGSMVPESVRDLRNFQAIVESVATFHKPKGAAGVPRSLSLYLSL